MATILERAQTAKHVEAILSDPKHPQFMRALEFATDRVEGPVPKDVNVRHRGPLVVRFVHEGK